MNNKNSHNLSVSESVAWKLLNPDEGSRRKMSRLFSIDDDNESSNSQNDDADGTDIIESINSLLDKGKIYHSNLNSKI